MRDWRSQSKFRMRFAKPLSSASRQRGRAFPRLRTCQRTITQFERSSLLAPLPSISVGIVHPTCPKASHLATDALNLRDPSHWMGNDVSAGHVFGECAVRPQSVGASLARSTGRISARRSRDGADLGSNRTLLDPEKTRAASDRRHSKIWLSLSRCHPRYRDDRA